MDEESNEDIDSTSDETEEVLKTEEVEETTPEVETEDDSEALVEKNKKLFERAKKAEADAREWKAKAQAPKPVEATAPEKQEGISALDAMALMGAKVTVEEDINEVVDYAKFKGISVSEALKATAIKSILAEKAEQRATSEATNTGVARRGVTKPSPDKILEDASKGKLPEKPEDLADAWMANKLRK